MKYQEKKYRVDSFIEVLEILNKANASKGKEVVNVHYYVQQESNDVVKLVKFSDRNEIHILKVIDGKYSLTENIPMPSVEAGLAWLKEKGYKTVNIVKMAYTDYDYEGGIVGLYIIDDFLYSVILDFPNGEHDKMEKVFGINPKDVIRIPYNKYLDSIGKLRSKELK